jgi:pyrroloquinoline quinone biosynthesis protein B
MARLQLIVIGSAAGGGFPQWNCGRAVSSLFWQGDTRVVPRTQSSIAASVDGSRWVLLNASPDLRHQIIATPALHPRAGERHSPIAAVVLTNGDIDHVAGLLTLRERQPFDLYATAAIQEVLSANPIFEALDRTVVRRHTIALGDTLDTGAGVAIEIFPVPGKIPLYMENGEPEIGAETEATVGARIIGRDGAETFYIPGCAHLSPGLRERLKDASLVLFDGTLWTDDEMIRQGVGQKTGQRMGHISMSGDGGSIAAFKDLGVARKVFVHINNTNPVLIDDSPQRRAAEEAGWEIAVDGMEIAL